ncbi:MAG TPA: hypothetical protein DHW82_11580 [Spirochaetia bacterium]|nr:MAG: hypothetical protein A2Y41_12125 [Spirochaetes bacterium GWB1_36_13]HCL57633.1 hypothetical protein [Spirochaetia bacterium]
MKRIFLIFLFAVIFTGCSDKKNAFSEETLAQIYASVELSTAEDAVLAVKKYGLDDESKRDAYYDALMQLSTDRKKWEAFLSKVEQYKSASSSKNNP